MQLEKINPMNMRGFTSIMVGEKRKCNNIDCTNSFTIDAKKKRQLYCCVNCRKSSTKNTRENNNLKKNPQPKTHKKYLVRGTISYEGYR